MVNTDTGEVVPARCGRNRCPYCLPLNARRRAKAIAVQRPARSITITNAAHTDDPDPWQTVRRRVNKTRELLLRDGIDPGLWCYFVERGSDTGMVHAHVAQRGPKKVPKEALQAAAHRAGAGWTRVEAIRSGGGFAQYVGKGFAGYITKGFDQDGVDEALGLNGGRLGHHSRGFFVSAQGESIGVRDAERLAHREGSGSWVLIREDSAALVAGRVLANLPTGTT